MASRFLPLLLQLSLTFSAQSAQEGLFNFTYAMAHQCKEHVSSFGYHYSPFYEINNNNNNNINNNNTELVLDMHVAILAASNGHILLSSTEKPKLSDPVYEIVIGGGSNKFSELRRQQKRDTRVSVASPQILSSVNFQPFHITVSQDGTIDVTREGTTLPLLHYVDPDPFPLRYFSFSSWDGVEAKFLYDCPAPGSNVATGNSTAVVRDLTAAERLKAALLSKRSPLSPPAHRIDVTLDINIASLQYDIRAGSLHTLLVLSIAWQDDAMNWTDNISALRLKQSEIWTPQLYLHNAVDTGALSRDNEPVVLLRSGRALLRVRAGAATWCEGGGSAWPRDSRQCALDLAPWHAHAQVKLDVAQSHDDDFVVLEKSYMGNEWELLSADYSLTSSAIDLFNDVVCGDVRQTPVDNLLRLNFTVRRRGALSLALYTPLLGVMVAMLMSFSRAPGTSPVTNRRSRRLALYSALTAIVAALLVYFDSLQPGHTLPSIMVLYSVVLISCVIALLVQVRISSLASLGSLPGLPFGCCQHQLEPYANFSEVDDPAETSPPPTSSRPLRPLRTESTRGYKSTPAGTIDAVMFATYFMVYSTMLAYHY